MEYEEKYTRSLFTYKLYEVPRNSIITLATIVNYNLFIDFSHIDGAYSLCTILGTNEICHIAASAEVYIWSKK